MRRNGVSNAMATGLLIAGILIGVAGFYVATTYQTKVVTQTKTVTQTETTTARPTATATVTVTPLKCGSVITTDTTLNANIGPCSGDGLVIDASHVVLNCAGHSISGINTNREISNGISLVGINLTGMSEVTVKDCYVMEFLDGFYLTGSSGNTLTGNAANYDTWSGFTLVGSSGNTLTNNTADNNTVVGFYLSHSSDNTLSVNMANDNKDCGFDLDGSSNNTLTGNTATNNSLTGFVLLDSSSKNNLSGNTANNNDWGFDLDGSSNDTLTMNTASSNGVDGFYLYGSSGNTLPGNTANNNLDYGYYDSSTGTGTAGTANFYTGDVCSGNGVGGSSPSGLGSPQS